MLLSVQLDVAAFFALPVRPHVFSHRRPCLMYSTRLTVAYACGVGFGSNMAIQEDLRTELVCLALLLCIPCERTCHGLLISCCGGICLQVRDWKRAAASRRPRSHGAAKGSRKISEWFV